MSDWYGMDGQRISMAEWAEMSRPIGDYDPRRVARTELPGGVWVSTVLLGLDHQYGDGPPLIFETMVFPAPDDFEEVDMDRYSTKEQALEGHDRMVTKWTGWTPGDEPISDDAMIMIYVGDDSE